MNFIEPMYAHVMPENFKPEPGKWVAEEKYDGHRIVVSVSNDLGLFGHRTVKAWSRDQKDRVLPPHIRCILEDMPAGIYDGELLVPGKRSYGVTVIGDVGKLVYVMFDVLHLMDRRLVAGGIEGGATYRERRAVLALLAEKHGFTDTSPVRMAWQEALDVPHQVEALSRLVWNEDGEGLILKRLDSLYRPGKRTKDWLKIKQLRSAILTIVGFQQGKMGPHSVIVLRDDQGFETTVKWKNLALLHQVEQNPASFVGRRVRIEFQEKTPDNLYRHPRWDRLAEEGE
jgi:ATP-dependent DNA ligase